MFEYLLGLQTEQKKDSNTDSTKPNNDSKYNYVFEWTDQKEELLRVGYLRQNITQAIPDILAILQKYYQNGYIKNYFMNNIKYSNIKYMSNNKFICNFNTYHYPYTSIAFKPFISTILANTGSNDDNNSNIICDMKFKKTKYSCSSKDHQEEIQYGVICLPLKYKMNLNDFKINFERKRGSLTQLYPWDASFSFYTTYCVEMHIFKKVTRTIKACIMRNESILCPRIITMAARKYYDPVDIHKVTNNDIFSAVIMSIDNKYCLRFKQNDKLIGEIKLDFTKFDYLFAISSECCDCILHNDGIQLEMSLSYV